MAKLINNARIIPSIQIDNGKLVKTSNFKNAKYIGNVMNVIGQFNEFQVDELMITDIGSAKGTKPPDLKSLERIAGEAFYPMSYGGGIKSLETAKKIIEFGFEKIVINSLLFRDIKVAKSLVAELGSQAIIAAADVYKSNHKFIVSSQFGTIKEKIDLISWFEIVDEVNVGEILITDVDREGTRLGLNEELVNQVKVKSTKPLIICGGTASHFEASRFSIKYDVSIAVGSAFVMYKDKDSVLLSYTTNRKQITTSVNIPNDKNSELNIFSPALTSIERSKVCDRCLISIDIPKSGLIDNDICDYCRFHDNLDAEFPTSHEGEKRLEMWVQRVKKDGIKKKYDCIVGVSGGTDSSFLLDLLVNLGLRPLAVHFDNTWNTHTASSNIYKVLSALNVDLETLVVESEEYDDIYKSFLLSGVKDLEAPTDIGFMGTLYRAARKYGIKHIVEGHSFRTEGVAPIDWTYMDGRYIRKIHHKFGEKRMLSYPNMSLLQFVKWAAISGIERSRPLYWINYNKEEAKHYLKQKFGWEWYGGHHLENRFTAFYFSYFLPKRWGIDYRQVEFSALVRSGQMTKSQAIEALKDSRPGVQESVRYLLKRLNLDENEFERMMNLPKRTYRDFPSYKTSFEFLKPIFWLFLKHNRVPESFYKKYCLRDIETQD